MQTLRQNAAMLHRTFERLIGAATADRRDAYSERLQALALFGPVTRGLCKPQQLLRRSLDEAGAWLGALGGHRCGTGCAASCNLKPHTARATASNDDCL
ncbi:MAG: hypothetical protein RMK97_03405 [Sutterellaceae bacterium]|nr:hypothetical protein [Burkholderiaceae bacterium]MDW8429538.1 hypothetical protein [Sutterellaceae bacterium]